VEWVIPRPLAPDVVRVGLVMELPPPTCEATPRGCVDCQLVFLLLDLMEPLPER